MRAELRVTSAAGTWRAWAYLGSLPRARLRADSPGFASLCHDGCRNYGRKHSCPPSAPPLDSLAPGNPWAHVVALRMPLAQFPQFGNPYHRVRMANSMLKSRLTRILLARRAAMPGSYALGSGACRCCRRCALPEGAPCRKPDRRLYSLEAVGVDCGHLMRECFGLELEWYRPGSPCTHTVAMGAVLADVPDPPPLAGLLRVLTGDSHDAADAAV